jgi:N-acetyl-gamma-glutamyl-phosphate reductase
MQASNGNHDISINFVPWRGDFTRGIFVSSTFKSHLSKEQIINILEQAYLNEPFTKVSLEPIHLKQVVNTNKCIINVEKEGNKVVVHSVIDNLLKGASGQAVQNMNILFGLDEKLGLNLKGSAF